MCYLLCGKIGPTPATALPMPPFLLLTDRVLVILPLCPWSIPSCTGSFPLMFKIVIFLMLIKIHNNRPLPPPGPVPLVLLVTPVTSISLISFTAKWVKKLCFLIFSNVRLLILSCSAHNLPMKHNIKNISDLCVAKSSDSFVVFGVFSRFDYSLLKHVSSF